MSCESEIVYDNTKTLDQRIKDRLKYDDKGLVCAVVQQYDTHEVLMVGYMDDEALRRTLTTGRVTFWSRSRQEYWRKGDTSGHVQYVKGLSLGLRRRRHSRGSGSGGRCMPHRQAQLLRRGWAVAGGHGRARTSGGGRVSMQDSSSVKNLGWGETFTVARAVP